MREEPEDHRPAAGEQAGLRKAVLRVYQIQREEFLPSAPGSTTRHARKPALRAGSG